nr:insulinase family protein [candidate division Zixibacteria bacterium]
MKMSGISALAGILLLLLGGGGLAAQDEMQFPVKQFTLDNGLTFLVVERHNAPVFSGYIVVGAGSAYEKIGDIGTAHLLEHMMFKGSQSIGTTDYLAEKELMDKEDSVWAKIDMARQQTRYIALNEPEKLEEHRQYISDLENILDSLTAASSEYVIQNEFDEIYTRNGAAEFNATTGYDFTHYFVSLPANRMELWFAMESDRLKHPALREFFPERDVVSEERRLSVENSPEAKLFEQLIGTAFIAHPYQIFWEWQSEENNLTRSDLRNFFDTYYIPSRLTVAVVGDVRLEEVQNLAERYFGDIPPAPDPEPIYTVEPEQPGERRVDVSFESNPVISIAYHKTAFDSDDEPAFRVIDRLLGSGRTSRLFKSLVIDRQLCLAVSTYTFPGGMMGDLHNAVFCIDAYPKEGIENVEVEKAIYEELEKLASVPVGERELQKVKNNIDAAFIWASYSNIGLAAYLATAQGLAKDWKYIMKMRDRLKAVTAEDIMNTTRKYFTLENRTVATLIPVGKGEVQ